MDMVMVLVAVVLVLIELQPILQFQLLLEITQLLLVQEDSVDLLTLRQLIQVQMELMDLHLFLDQDP